MRVVCWLKVAKCVHRMNEVGVFFGHVFHMPIILFQETIVVFSLVCLMFSP